MIGYTSDLRLVPFAIRLRLPDKNLDGIVFTSPDRFFFTLTTAPPPFSARCYWSFANTHPWPEGSFRRQSGSKLPLIHRPIADISALQALDLSDLRVCF